MNIVLNNVFLKALLLLMLVCGAESKPNIQISEVDGEVGKKAFDDERDQHMDRRGKTFGSDDGNGLGYVLENLGK